MSFSFTAFCVKDAEISVMEKSPCSIMISKKYEYDIRVFLEPADLLALRDQITEKFEKKEAAKELCVVKRAEAA